MGVSTSLTWYDVGALLLLIQMFDVRTILEIGVEHGGATALFASLCRYTGRTYRGIDITLNALSHAVIEHDGANLYQRDAWAQDTIDELAAWLHTQAAPCLIFCDGGDKPKELHLYASILRSGDVLVGHDYHNEYTEDAVADIPLDRISADWLDDTLLCVWRKA